VEDLCFAQKMNYRRAKHGLVESVTSIFSYISVLKITV